MIITADYASVPLSPSSVHLIVTSPPYPGQRGCTLSVPQWLTWFQPLLLKMRSELVEDGVIALNVAFKRHAFWYDTRQFRDLLTLIEDEANLHVIDIYPWDKRNPAPSGNLRGSAARNTQRRYDLNAWEPVFLLAKSAYYHYTPVRQPYQPKSQHKLQPHTKTRSTGVNGSYSGGHSNPHPKGALPHNVLRLSPTGGQPRPRAAGGSFPLALPTRFILQHTQPGDLVLDPFCGVGTTCIAAAQLNRLTIGIDNNPTATNQAKAWLKTIATTIGG